MRLLLDTHALLWFLTGNLKLPVSVRAAITGSEAVFVSAASIWEIATKFRLGKLPDAWEIATESQRVLDREGFLALPLSVAHAQRAGSLPGPHRDPFDRMLIAQALLDELTLVSNEQLFEPYGVSRLW